VSTDVLRRLTNCRIIIIIIIIIRPTSLWSSSTSVSGDDAIVEHCVHRLSACTTWPKYCSFLLLTAASKRHVGLFSSTNIILTYWFCVLSNWFALSRAGKWLWKNLGF